MNEPADGDFVTATTTPLILITTAITVALALRRRRKFALPRDAAKLPCRDRIVGFRVDHGSEVLGGHLERDHVRVGHVLEIPDDVPNLKGRGISVNMPV